ncbi:MAG: methyltransferase domain-containing protein [Actinobacteria bacterium]|nr:methyltransferase domain-containing protein [Actinomycetota bacterium]
MTYAAISTPPWHLVPFCPISVRCSGRSTTPRGIGARDAQSIAAHYDRDPRLFGQFLDPDYLCYTHGLFDSGTDSLQAAIVRKLDWAHGALRIAPGGRVLDVGGGWGAFLVYGAERGLDITSLTLSGESEQYMRSRLKETGLSGRVVLKHFFDFTSQDRFHGIVNMGATEHLPNYRRSFSKYRELLLPGGILYVDCLAAARKFRLSSFLTKHVYPGGQSPMVLPAYLRAAAREGFTVLDVRNDRGDYAETCRRWVSRLREREEEIVDQWGVESFRFFNAWLGASAVSFDSGLLQAYRLVLRAP